MATSTSRFASPRASLRSAVSSFISLVGPGGIVSHVASQDLLIITDFNALLVLKSAATYIRPHKLKAVAEYTHKRRELPGAHILDPDMEYEGGDIRYRSGLSQQSLYVLDLIALADAQHSSGVEFRRLLLEKERNAMTVTLGYGADRQVVVGRKYYDSLVRTPHVRTYTGIYDFFKEPTTSWRSMLPENKGVFFTADSTYYGLIMPHAKIDNASGEDRDHD